MENIFMCLCRKAKEQQKHGEKKEKKSKKGLVGK